MAWSAVIGGGEVGPSAPAAVAVVEKPAEPVIRGEGGRGRGRGRREREPHAAKEERAPAGKQLQRASLSLSMLIAVNSAVPDRQSGRVGSE